MVMQFNTLPLPIGINGEMDLSNFELKDYSLFLFKDILQDIEMICSQFEKLIYNDTFAISAVEKCSFNFHPRKIEDIYELFGGKLLTSSLFLQSFDGKFSAYNSPKDEFSAFFFRDSENLSAASHLLFERFREMVRSGVIGFPDAAIPYFNDLLSPVGMSI